MKLVYQAYDRSGRAVTDTVDAPNEGEALQQLRRDGLFVLELRPPTGRAEAADPAGSVAARRSRHSTRHLRHLAMFTRQLHVLVSTGTPMVDALAGLERQTRDKQWKQVIGELRIAVEEGATLGDAMEKRSDWFDGVYRSLIAAGEAGGRFEIMLDRLTQLVRRQQHVRSSIQGAMTYPALLFVVAMVVLVLLLTFVLPRFADLFDTMQIALPPSTQLMLTVSEFLRSYWWLALITIAATGTGAYLWMGSARGRELRDTLLARTPYIRGITRGFATARITRLLGTLLENSVPLLEALDLTRHATGNVHYQRLVIKAVNAVTRGEPVSAAFRDESLIDPSIYEAIRSGETTGQIAPLMMTIADFLDEDNEIILRSLTSILEPVILVILGLLVGTVALSMFLPLFDLTASVGG
ncbi:MAG: type II secretion system F family protein [Phycisphaeraceae bacterium]